MQIGEGRLGILDGEHVEKLVPFDKLGIAIGFFLKETPHAQLIEEMRAELEEAKKEFALELDCLHKELKNVELVVARLQHMDEFIDVALRNEHDTLRQFHYIYPNEGKKNKSQSPSTNQSSMSYNMVIQLNIVRNNPLCNSLMMSKIQYIMDNKVSHNRRKEHNAELDSASHIELYKSAMVEGWKVSKSCATQDWRKLKINLGRSRSEKELRRYGGGRTQRWINTAQRRVSAHVEMSGGSDTRAWTWAVYNNLEIVDTKSLTWWVQNPEAETHG
ncbi:hypothetical protein KI387_013386, partial [Taxus chinensis]